MQTGLGRTQQALLAALLHQPAGMSIDELAVRLGVTRTAVRQHLAALERDGLIERGPTRPTGRRPEQLHQLSERGRELFPRQYQLLGDLLLEEMAQRLGEEQLVELLRGLGRRLAAGLEQQAVDDERIVAHMDRIGYAAELIAREGGGQEIVAHSCVFHHLASHHPQVCELDLALLGALGGAKVEHCECMLRGGSVCRFRLQRDE